MKKTRKKKYRLNWRFYLLLAISAAVISAYFMVNAVALADYYDDLSDLPYGQDGNATTPPEPIDITRMSMNFDDVNMIYIFYYEDMPLDISRHHIIDDEGLVNFVSHNPALNKLNIAADAPLVFFINYDYASHNVYINAANPRSIYERIVVIDAGHGGIDTGAIVGNVREADITLSISLYLYELFQDSTSGIKAYMTRIDDSTLQNIRRSHMANTIGDFFVSIHTNVYRPSEAVAGTETLFNDNSPMSTQGNQGRFNMENSHFAQIMQNHLIAELNTRDRGAVQRDDLLILNTASIPTAFLEIDFKTNPQSLANLLSSAYQQRIAMAIYNGIVASFNEANPIHNNYSTNP